MSGSAVPVTERPALRLGAQTWAIGTILVAAAALRLHGLGTTSLWTDELFTAAYAKSGLAYLWTEGLRTEPTPPLYYSLIALWERVAGDGALALRLPSFVGSLLGIGLAVLLARELFAQVRAPVFAALLLALAPMNILHAQEARAYALQGAALALASLGFARFLREPARAAGLSWYAAGAALACYLHPTSAVAVAAFNLAALCSVLGRGRLLDGAGLLRWCAANALVALLCLPLLPGWLSPTASVATAWVPGLSRWSLETVLGTALAGPAIGRNAMLVAEIGIPVLAALLVLPPWSFGRRAATVLLLVPSLFLVFAVAVSAVKPILLARTVAWVLLPLAVALGHALACRTSLIAFGLVGALAAATALHVSRAETLVEDWRGFLGRLPGLERPALVVLAPHTSPAALARYAPGIEPVRVDDGSPPIPETTVIPRIYGTRSIPVSEFQAAVAAGGPVWLIYRRPEYDWMLKATAGLPPPKLAMQQGEGSNPNIRALFW